MLRHIECGVQNGPITKNGILPVTTLFFRKFCFNLETSQIVDLIYQSPKLPDSYFSKALSFI